MPWDPLTEMKYKLKMRAQYIPRIIFSALVRELCAANQLGVNLEVVTRTSFAAPAVVGLAAQFLSPPRVVLARC